MIKENKTEDYIRAIEIGFNYYGLNGFYEMHKDICKHPKNPWSYNLECLNDLNYNEFELLCTTYLKSI